VARWTDVSDDPNSPEATRLRAASLAVPHEVVASRVAHLTELARGRRVLDIGCTGHTSKGREGASFLHRHLREAAATCIGVDLDLGGLGQLRASGLGGALVQADAAADAPFRPGSFDLVVAGELIEHLGAPEHFLQGVAQLLEGDARLVVTTPNPYAPKRVAAGRRGDAVENVDHVTYLFPSGMCELASRTGLVLTHTAETTAARYATEVGYSVRALGAAVKRRLRGSSPPPGRRLPLPADYVSPIAQLTARSRGETMWRGETAIYTFRRAAAG
jgi:SAM-dependent methyltransferase